MTGKLRLRATDAEDLAVIAACLQDARVDRARDAVLAGGAAIRRRFIRYRRERQADWSSCEGLTECPAALVFDGIESVKYRGLDPASRTASWAC